MDKFWPHFNLVSLWSIWYLTVSFLLCCMQVEVNVDIRSMGPVDETRQVFSLDCYFRQYWRDSRLSFKGLKKNANNLVINQLSLDVAMLEKIWKPGGRRYDDIDTLILNNTPNDAENNDSCVRRHLLPQRARLVSARNHSAQQAPSHLGKRRHYLLY